MINVTRSFVLLLLSLGLFVDTTPSLANTPAGATSLSSTKALSTNFGRELKVVLPSTAQLNVETGNNLNKPSTAIASFDKHVSDAQALQPKLLVSDSFPFMRHFSVPSFTNADLFIQNSLISQHRSRGSGGRTRDDGDWGGGGYFGCGNLKDYFGETAISFINRCCKGSVWNVFPGDLKNYTIGEIFELQKSSKKAKTAWKLMSRSQYRK